MKPLSTRLAWSARTLLEAHAARRLPFRGAAAVAAVQRRRIRAIVRHAYESVPFYRAALDARGLRPADFERAEDLDRLPLVASADVAADWSRFRSSRIAPEDAFEAHSSGTAGRAHRFTHDARSLFLVLAAGQRHRDVLAAIVGRSLGYRELSVQRTGGLSTQLRRFYETHAVVPRRIEIERSDVPSSAPFEEIAAAIDAFRPDVLRGYGSQLGALFRWAEASGARFTLPRVVTYGGDAMPEADRRRIEQRFGVPVWSTYQAGEAFRIAYQCERREGFHVELDQIAVRLIDEEGRTLGPGARGQVVISNLVNRATVLLNYRLGDVVTWSKEPCPCGRAFPTIERIDGRADDWIAMPRGSPVHALSILGPLFDRFPELAQVQLVQRELRRFQLRVVAGARPGEREWTEVVAGTGRVLRDVLGPDLALDVRRVEAIEPEASGKVRTVVSHVR